GTRRRPNVLELSGPVILEQQIALRVTRAVAKEVDVVDNITVRDCQIEIRVVVVIEKQCAEPHERQRRLPDAAFERDVRKQSSSNISVEAMSLAVEIRNEDVEQSVAVDVAHVSAHAGEGLSIVADGDPCQ